MLRPRKSTIAVGCVIFISAVLILSLLVQKTGIPSVKFTSAEDPIARYSAATEKLSKHHDMQLIVSTQEITKTKENVFQTSEQQNITYLNRDSNDLQISATETIDMGPHTLQTSVIYSNGTLYHTLNDAKFTGNCNPEALSVQYPPPVILDPDSYQNITGLQVGDSTVVFFRAPTQPEGWSGIDDTVFQDAWGSAWVDNNGNLIRSTYNLSCTKGQLIIYRSVTVQIAGFDPDPINIPTDLSDYVQLSDPLLPTQLEIACGYLLQSKNIEAYHTDTTTCQIFGDTRLQSIDVLIRNDTDDPFLEMTTVVEVRNNSREGETLSSRQVQQYSNGNYSLSTNGEPAVITEGASSRELLAGCQEILIGTILLPHYVQDAKIIHSDDTYRIEFIATDAFAQKVISNACMVLYDEPQLLDELSTEHHIDNILCYLEFSKGTGLPTKSGIHLLGTYYVGDLPYQLIFESDQTYHIE